jgi:hypothetical protein
MNDWVRAEWLAKHPGPYKVGDRVSFLMVPRRIEGVIVEDRGNLGIGGERIYGLTFLRGNEEVYTEMPVSELQLVARAPEEEKKSRKK